MMKTKLSKIVMGTMGWGTWGKDLNAHEMASRILACVDTGISSFDHADIYGGFTTEAAFGEAFVVSGINRSEVQFVSKCGIQMSGHRGVVTKHYNYSAGYIVASVEQSLRNLQTDYLDVLLLHRPSPLMEVSEVCEAITRLQKEGKIVDFGVSNFEVSQMELLADDLDLGCNQLSFSLINHEPMLNGVLDYMQKRKMVAMAWAPLGGVFGEAGSTFSGLMDVLGELSLKYGVSVDVLLLAWVMRHPIGVRPVCGTASMERISELHLATKLELELEDWFRMWEVVLGREVN